MSKNFRFVDLFAGVGGFHHALADPALDGECVLAVEKDPLCQLVYRHAFPGTRLEGDIRSITRRADGSDASPEEIRAVVPEHEVLCAGFPCQPFSKSGAQRGIRDQTRGTLFFDIMEVVRARLPRFVVLENVANLAGPRHKTTWKLIIAALRDAGYRVAGEPVILSPHRLPAPVGSPQARPRVFILATRDAYRSGKDEAPLLSKMPDPSWSPSSWSLGEYLIKGSADRAYSIRPVETMWLSAWEAFLNGLPDDRLPGFPLWTDTWRLPAPVERDMPDWKVEIVYKNVEFYSHHRAFLDHWLSTPWDSAGTTIRDFPPSRRKFEWQARSVHPRRAGRTLWDLLIHLRPSGIRVKPATYFPALVAMAQTSIVAGLGRRITPEEAAKLQRIPFAPFSEAGISDAEIYKQLGNAVHVGVAKLVASTLFGRSGLGWGATVQTDILRLIA
jgi:DNA (cytosine-5)-methyltransferase 1